MGDLKKKNKELEWRQFIVHQDELSFKGMFEAFYGPLYGYGMKLCSHPELVKDTIHDLFMNIWERRDRLQHINSPNVYLYVSLRRKIIRERKEQRKKTNDLTEVDESAYITFACEEIIIRDEVKFQQEEELQKALNQLSNRQKEVIYLHYYNGLSYSEIEKILSINRQSVRNHIYRTMETLRSMLDMEIMKLVSSLLMTILFLH
jgi:RNA polymerase sigma factor (sigma-70 family)